MVNFVPSSNMAITVSSGRLGIWAGGAAGGAVCALATGTPAPRQMNTKRLKAFMAGCFQPVYHAVLSGNAAAALLRRAGIGTRVATLVATLNLGAPAPLLQVAGSFLFGGIADLDVVIDRHHAPRPGHTGD